MNIDYEKYNVLFDYLMPGEKHPSESKRVRRLLEICRKYVNGDSDEVVGFIGEFVSKSNDLLSVKSDMMKIHISFSMKFLNPNVISSQYSNIRRVDASSNFDNIFSDDLVSWYAQVIDNVMLADYSFDHNSSNHNGRFFYQWDWIKSNVISHGQWVVDIEMEAKWIFEIESDEFKYVVDYLSHYIWGRKAVLENSACGVEYSSLITISNFSDKARLLVYLIGRSNGVNGSKLILRDCKKAWQTYKRRRKNAAEGRYNFTASLSVASREKLSILRDRWQLTQDELVELIIDRAYEQDAKRLEKLKE